MTSFLSLLLPIVVAAIAVFILSMIVHAAMPWHRSDYGNVPDRDAAIPAVQSLKLAPGDYAVPDPELPRGGKNPTFIADLERGPTFHLTWHHRKWSTAFKGAFDAIRYGLMASAPRSASSSARIG